MGGSNQTRSPELILRDEEERRAAATRYDNLSFVLRRETTKEIIFGVGGTWDNLERKYLPKFPEYATFVNLIESQIEFATWFGDWVKAYKNDAERRTRILLTAGERRGGKTTIGLLCMIATLLAVPNSIGWAVSSTYSERDELERVIAEYIPKSWYVYKGSPRFRYIFHNGSVLRNLSGDDPEVLKQGQVDIVLINEAQKMNSRVLTNALPGVIDRGGIVILAANPAARTIGLWVNDMKEAHDLGKFGSCDLVKFFQFDAKLNQAIDQVAKGDIGAILNVIDPRVAAADADGLWLPVGDVAYPTFRALEHVKPAPEIGEMTQQISKSKTGRAYDYVNGMDFQKWPHMAGVALKIYRGLDGKPIYWVSDELLREGTEDEFLDTVDEKKLWTTDNTVWIGDASGTWQNGAHSRGRSSFDIFKSRRWIIHPTQKSKSEDRKPSNPDIADRLGLVNNLLLQQRLMVDPEGAPRLAIALKKCELKNHKPAGKYAHITDALGYALWWLEPKAKPAKRTVGGPDAFNLDISRKGSDYI